MAVLPTASESPLLYACDPWVFAMCPALRGSTVSYVGDAHFPKHASSTLERPVFDLLLEGVPMDWAGIFLPSVDSRVPDRVWERMVRRNQAAPYVLVGPRDRMVRVPAAEQPPVVDPPPATSSAPQPVQPEMDDVDMAAAVAAEDDVAMDGEAAGSAAELEEEDEEIL